MSEVWWTKLLREAKKRWFIISLVVVIASARGYPYLGSKEGIYDNTQY